MPVTQVVLILAVVANDIIILLFFLLFFFFLFGGALEDSQFNYLGPLAYDFDALDPMA